MPFNSLTHVAALCERYGPGRLPGADRQDIGGGYAMATTAAVAAVAFALVGQIPGIGKATAIGPFWFGYLGIPGGVYAVQIAAVAMLLVVPSAFVAGFLMWQEGTPSDPSLSGRISGLLATVLTYLIATVALALVAVAWALFQIPVELVSGVALPEIVTGMLFLPVLAMLAGMFAFVATFWITLPLGALGGHIHDAARTAR